MIFYPSPDLRILSSIFFSFLSYDFTFLSPNTVKYLVVSLLFPSIVGNSTNSDRYQTVFADLVSKIVDVDDDVSTLPVGSLGGSLIDDNQESRSRSSSDIFSLDG